MKKDFISVRPSGSEKNEPKVMSEVLNEYFQSDEPLAVAFRNWKAQNEAATNTVEEADEDQLFKSVFPNTELGVDLKLITRESGRMEIGAFLDGAITHDGEDHFTFIQNASEKKKVDVTQRNPHVYEGKRINVNRKDDGTLYPTFNHPRYTREFTFQDFCREAAEELLTIVGLVEETQKGK